MGSVPFSRARLPDGRRRRGEAGASGPRIRDGCPAAPTRGSILRRVTSRHVARVHDAGDDESGVWLVTELVEGAALTVATLGRPLLPHEVLRVARGLLEGLAAVHAAGIVHGDVKPSNILVPLETRRSTARRSSTSGSRASSRARRSRRHRRGDDARGLGPRDGSLHGAGGPHWRRADGALGPLLGGLVLFELLDDGALSRRRRPCAAPRARLDDVHLRDRVPEPLSDVLERMLARASGLAVAGCRRRTRGGRQSRYRSGLRRSRREHAA